MTVRETEAVNRFSEWLTTKTVEREVSTGVGAGNVKIVLAGHRCVPTLLLECTLTNNLQYGRYSRSGHPARVHPDTT